jgi:hypothetical protein
MIEREVDETRKYRMLHFNARVDDENFLLLHFLQLTLYAMA